MLICIHHFDLGVIALVAVVLVMFVILIRRGHFQPVQRGISTARTIVVQKTREKLYGEAAGSRRRRQNAYVYDVRFLFTLFQIRFP